MTGDRVFSSPARGWRFGVRRAGWIGLGKRLLQGAQVLPQGRVQSPIEKSVKTLRQPARRVNRAFNAPPPCGVKIDAGDVGNNINAARVVSEAKKAAAVGKILRAEVSIAPLVDPARLSGCGLIVVNPPWTLEQELQVMLPELAAILSGADRGGFRIDRISGEF